LKESGQITIADDAVFSATLGETYGSIVEVTSAGQLAESGAMIFETTGTATSAIVWGGADFEVTTGVLAGTTGTDVKTTVSITDAGVLYIENRNGNTRSYRFKVTHRQSGD